MRPGVISIGADRALVRLSSGEYLEIDPNTVDAANYLVGRPVEPHIAFVFRCFLHPHAAVLDIGANFGLYTAIAAGVIRTRGRLFAFEANPHTFAFLNRTLYANGVVNNANITIVNKLRFQRKRARHAELPRPQPRHRDDDRTASSTPPTSIAGAWNCARSRST